MKTGQPILAALVAFAIAGCSTVRPAPGPRLCHVVICTLKERGDEAAVRTAVERSHTFREIPGVVLVEAGAKIPMQRPGVAEDYDVGVMMVFEDRAAYEAYLVHPRHEAAVREVLVPLSERVVIYDFEAANR